jgi:hypothetical protein
VSEHDRKLTELAKKARGSISDKVLIAALDQSRRELRVALKRMSNEVNVKQYLELESTEGVKRYLAIKAELEEIDNVLNGSGVVEDPEPLPAPVVKPVSKPVLRKAFAVVDFVEEAKMEFPIYKEVVEALKNEMSSGREYTTRLLFPIFEEFQFFVSETPSRKKVIPRVYLKWLASRGAVLRPTGRKFIWKRPKEIPAARHPDAELAKRERELWAGMLD